ncbi:TlpA disulfide reductase family protein [Marinifilum caeruleilacunae]|uniref:AhpC/TSA family protein n=1 Tax=Marinifilum caeruleilacunae TaxID=2499076 RepID=A0ABX1WTG6_9BACT|nr:TlpA disulfide reductase family protein [Marinifilum caeruleilacunae]NOU59302.1 AhpC/TSA family protein [Marinifilum caeruleilacunae]
MRTIIILLLATLMISCGKTQKHDGYILTGEIEGIANGKIVLSYYDRVQNKALTFETAIIEDGKFELKGKMEYPQELNVSITPGDANFSFWLENDAISLKADMKNTSKDRWGRISLPVQLSGGKIQKEFEAYEYLLKPIQEEQKPYTEAFDKANMAYMKGMKAKLPEEELLILKNKAQATYDAIKPFTSRMSAVNRKYMDDHPNSFVTANILKWSMSHMKPAEAQAKFELFSDQIKNSPLGKEIQSEIKKSLSGSPGNMAAGFQKMDINSKEISLEDFKGQYVLLDFWASWCKPCRAGNPHLIDLYNKYHKKGIEFIGIASDDNNVPAWHKAVKKDQIGIWRHILSGTKEQGNDIGSAYAIHTLPTKILIDPEGKIIGRYGADGDTDEAMDKMFQNIFGE